MQKVSIVLTTYNRYGLLRQTLSSIYGQNYPEVEVIVVDDGNDTETPAHMSNWPDVKYIRLNRKKHEGFYNNPAYPINVGFRAATGDVVILQNAECKHVSANVIRDLVARTTDTTTPFASVLSLNNDDSPSMWYIHPVFNPRPFFFCGAVKRAVVEKLRGMDEDYIYYGMDDNDFADRLVSIGVMPTYHADIVVHHLWHPPAYTQTNLATSMETNNKIYDLKTEQMKQGTITATRNLDREWGQFNATT